MKAIYKFFLFTLFNSILAVNAQNTTLTTGMEVPEITFSQTINFGTSTTSKLSDFRGKMVILDFWATWCSPCIAAIPKIDAIQNKFNDSVVFLPVTYQDRKIVKPFLERLYRDEKIQMKSIIEDTVIGKMFPHTSIPFFVWINQKGEIIATTDASKITSENIHAALKNGFNASNKPLRKYRFINDHQSIFPTTIAYTEKSGGNNDLIDVIDPKDVLYQSTLTRYNSNLAGKTHYDSAQFIAINTPIINFYRLYFGCAVYKKFPLIFWSTARCKVEIADSSLSNKINTKKKGTDYLNWAESNAYTYELNWKNCKSWDEKFALLKGDLDRYFGEPLGIEAEIENRMVPSDVLVRISGSETMKESDDNSEEEHDAFFYKQKGEPISALINRLQGYYWQTSDSPVFDESGLKGKYNIDIECNMNDLDLVNAQLAKYGLKFIKADRKAEVLVIRKKEKKDGAQ
ncbi:redoxin family protein [Mucilaginibacter sp. L196]|uniref:redoxin family protein n=1 Tax=Mucilaginibacter sp. L196 TaxID=1641870 RepID=UPI00131E8601|nr:redoxin family protein [Mucilaginibacter sp. L196]